MVRSQSRFPFDKLRVRDISEFANRIILSSCHLAILLSTYRQGN